MAVHRTDAGLPVFTGDPAELAPEERDWLDARRGLGCDRGRLRGDAPHEAADGGVRAQRLPGRAGRVDRGEAPRLERLRRRHRASFTKDEILTNVTIYWLTGTIGSSMRMYHANAAIPPAQLARRVEVPSGFSLFAGDVVRPPRAWLERTANRRTVTEPPRGGHFAPFEEPELYARNCGSSSAPTGSSRRTR